MGKDFKYFNWRLQILQLKISNTSIIKLNQIQVQPQLNSNYWAWHCSAQLVVNVVIVVDVFCYCKLMFLMTSCSREGGFGLWWYKVLFMSDLTPVELLLKCLCYSVGFNKILTKKYDSQNQHVCVHCHDYIEQDCSILKSWQYSYRKITKFINWL